MRINRYIAASTTLSRRAADQALSEGRVLVNGRTPAAGYQVQSGDTVSLDGQQLVLRTIRQTILLNKPVGYVVSRDGQGSPTIYDLLPPDLYILKPVGRLDKDSSGLLLLTTDGALAEQLTHPRYQKQKVYIVRLDHPLSQQDAQTIATTGVHLEDGPSRLGLSPLDQQGTLWHVVMSEGRNRQIRRTFAARGYAVTQLHRTHFGEFVLPQSLPPGSYLPLSLV